MAERPRGAEVRERDFPKGTDMDGDPDELVMLICDKCGPVGVTSEDRQEADARDHTREAHGTDVAFREA